jgi:hypothetical protein
MENYEIVLTTTSLSIAILLREKHSEAISTAREQWKGKIMGYYSEL